MGTHPRADPSLHSLQYGWAGRWFRPRKGTLGAMDLGGASTQITFETASPAEDPANEVQLRLYGQLYRVYTHSFLCYGRDQVLRRLLASALQVPSNPSPPAPLRLLGGRVKKGCGPRAQSRAWAAAMLRAAPASGNWLLHRPGGQDLARAKARWLGVSARPGREEGWRPISEKLRRLAAGSGVPGTAAEHSGDSAKGHLWEAPQAGAPEALHRS